jgi:hypothetical protein
MKNLHNNSNLLRNPNLRIEKHLQPSNLVEVKIMVHPLAAKDQAHQIMQTVQTNSIPIMITPNSIRNPQWRLSNS